MYIGPREQVVCVLGWREISIFKKGLCNSLINKELKSENDENPEDIIC